MNAPKQDPLGLGQEALRQGHWAKAEACFRQAIVFDLDQPGPWYWLGQLHELRGDLYKAAHCYFLACEAKRYKPALESLERLGYSRLR